MSFQISVIKKNQILVWGVTLMLVVAGYLNYQNDKNQGHDMELTSVMDENLGDAVFVDSNNLVTNIDSLVENIGTQNKKYTSSEYFLESRMNRNNLYAEQIEMYERMLKDTSLESEQKKMASSEIKRINDEKNAILIAENLIRLKGMEEVVILRNKESVNVVVLEDNLDEAKVAQIQNIVQNELGIEVKNIHVTSLAN